jgi:D-alanyl-D-alanine carboxypeptidase
MFPGRRVVVVLLVVASSIGAGPATAGRTAPDQRCRAPAATDAALRDLTGIHGIVGVAVELFGPRCGRWAVTSGVADLRTGRPMAAGERVRIGSTTKTFTATVVLQLAAEGRIGLDAPVERYLPGVVRGNGYDGARITVRDLLRHTSGLPDHVNALDRDAFPDWRYRTFTPAELVSLALDQPHPEQPWTYSTTNSVLAGMIVERITGHDIGHEITHRVIRPLGLHDTYWPGGSPHIRGPHPRGYSDGVDTTDLSMSWGGAGGALVSSLSDENRFFAALLGGRLLPPAYLRQMMTTVETDPDRLWPGARYGLGLISTPLNRCGIGTFWGHGGTLPGFETVGASTPDGRRAQLVINSNTTSQESWQALHTALEVALCDAR